MNTSTARTRQRRWLLPGASFGVISLIHLVAQLTGHRNASSITQVLLMSLLAVTVFWVARTPRSRIIKLLLLALGFSWLGDTAPRFMSGDAGFLTMVGFFLLAQIVYIYALLPHRDASVLRKPAALLPYFALFAVLLIICAPKAGPLLIPVILYGLALMTMAILSTGLGKIAGIGGAIFFISDSLIAVRSLGGISLPQHGFLIMLTYIVAQALLAYAFVAHDNTTRGNPTAAPASAEAV